MSDLMTTEEAASYLRLSERKLYDLVAAGAVPCTKATGRWLFPRSDLDHWLAVEAIKPNALSRIPAPQIVGGSQDPLLDWALRESGSGLASLPEGSESGLRRLRNKEVIAAAIHLHRLDGNDENANLEAVSSDSSLYDAVVVSFARREQGLLVAPGNPKQLSDMKSVVKSRSRLAVRPQGAGAQLLLLALLKTAQADPGQISKDAPVCHTGADIAQAVREGRADCGIATRAVAVAAGVDFVSLTWERFDLVLRQRDYFLPPQQSLFNFLRSASFRNRAKELPGYDIAEAGQIRLVT
ncbi:MAG: helix-turn-helix transcriptional regulator [Xanthobacteraceae bacterium]|nr:helix-turn-helix transcriptional regulator [Xanthobacteraceae bacterium]